jgi:hypothetical protein
MNEENNTITLKGRSTLRAYPAGTNFQTGPIYEQTVDNLVVTAGKELVAEFLISLASVGLTYHAIGTDSTAPAVGDTSLGAEESRKTWTIKSRSGRVVTYEVFYLAAESNINIAESGTFGGETASATPDSGILFSRYLQPYDNSAGLVDLTFEYNLEVT